MTSSFIDLNIISFSIEMRKQNYLRTNVVIWPTENYGVIIWHSELCFCISRDWYGLRNFCNSHSRLVKAVQGFLVLFKAFLLITVPCVFVMFTIALKRDVAFLSTPVKLPLCHYISSKGFFFLLFSLVEFIYTHRPTGVVTISKDAIFSAMVRIAAIFDPYSVHYLMEASEIETCISSLIAWPSCLL